MRAINRAGYFPGRGGQSACIEVLVTAGQGQLREVRDEHNNIMDVMFPRIINVSDVD